METETLYSGLARYYDLLYEWKDYRKDVDHLIAILDGKGITRGSRLLDVGCGTGGHIQLLVDRFDCTGVDVHEEMLEVARGKVPAATFVRGDMRDLELGRTFDVVISMFGTLGYASTRDDLERTVGTLSGHLRPGGVALIEPWLMRSDLRMGHVGMVTHDDGDLKISRLSTLALDGDLTHVEMHYLIGERGKDIRYEVERHVLRLFDPDETLAIMSEKGLDGTFLPGCLGKGDDLRGLIVAERR